MINKTLLNYTLHTLKKTSRIILVISLTNLVLFLLISLMTNTSLKNYFHSKKLRDTINFMSGKDLYQFLGVSNLYFVKSIDLSPTNFFTIDTIFKTIANITISDHRSLLGNEFPGFRQFDSKIIIAGDGTNYTNMPFESVPPDEILKPSVPKNNEVEDSNVEPSEIRTDGNVVHIYFTHTRESYLPELDANSPDVMSTEINVTNVGEHLLNSLQAGGIGTTIDKTDVINLLLSKSKKYAQAYSESRELVEAAFANNKNLNYIIDIHRDSQPRNLTTIETNDTIYAKIAFIIGGNNPNYERNTNLAQILHEKMNNMVPGISRGVFAKSGTGTNGVYNQDLSDNAILIEIGGIENSLTEAFRCAEVFANAFGEYYWETKQ